jgi:hypothetical protein
MHAALNQGQFPAEHVLDESYWKTLNPDLHITTFPFSASALLSDTNASLVDRCTSRMIKDGYFDAPSIIPREKAERFAAVVTRLSQLNVPPVFAFVYDEFWQLFYQIDPVLRSLLGDDYKMLPLDIWGWRVGMDSAGWAPHRDMLTKDSVRENKKPRVINVWIPLTDATPLNSCMYVLPAHLDPNIPDQLEDGSRYRITSFQNIRAVPAVAGSALGWNTQVMHWGGRSSEWADQPRISVAIYVHSKDCDLQELDYCPSRSGFTAITFDKTFEMPFKSRLRAIAGAMQLYHEKVHADFPAFSKDLFAFSRNQLGSLFFESEPGVPQNT